MNQNKGIRWLAVFFAILALTVFACQGAGGFNPFATQTPTPTNTFTPTPTFTVTPSPTPTSTLTSTPTPLPTGVKLEPQSDGSSLFIDYDNKYQLILPADWIIIPLKKEDLNIMISKLADENPDLATAAEAFKNLDSNVLRMAALNSNRKYITAGFGSNITITAIENDTLSAMPLSFITAVLEDTFQKQGMKVLTTGVNTIENAHNVDVEFIDVEQVVGGKHAQQHVIVFQSGSNLILITVTTLQQFKDEVFQMSNQIAASIVLLK